MVILKDEFKEIYNKKYITEWNEKHVCLGNVFKKDKNGPFHCYGDDSFQRKDNIFQEINQEPESIGFFNFSARSHCTIAVLGHNSGDGW